MKLYPLLFAIIFAGFILTTTSCRKNGNNMTEAIVTGYDGRMCACCGGLMITFDGQSRPYSGDFKLIDNSADLGFSINEPFPVYVKVSWTEVPNKCNGNYIKVTKLERN